ncbi:alginate lyase-domain-containing protein [Circinella umbellata]|nr:alginate lyase-domain-containing protein [Circinella umbellata]
MKHLLVYYTSLWILCILSGVKSSMEEDGELEGDISLDDDTSMTLMKSDLEGWEYPLPKASDPPDTISNDPFPFVAIDPDILRINKQHMHDYDRGLQHALWFLKKKADRYVTNHTVFSVVNKTIAVPGGNDKHDYMSLARYFWPNTSQPNGMPYIRQDGKTNPEINKVPDYTMFRELVQHVHFLSLGYHYFDNETYAERATQRVYEWFVDPNFRMNPHLQFASLIRGYKTGRAKGVIDFHVVHELLDSISIIQYSDIWQERNKKQRINAHLRYWFAQYMIWLTQSPNGIHEMESHNNHGTFYDVQRTSIYLFLNKTELARQVIANASVTRIAPQVLISGEQYMETTRADSWFYCIFNLQAYFTLGRIGERIPNALNLFEYETMDHKSIQLALDFLLPYAFNETMWPFHNMAGFDATALFVQVLEEAYIAYKNDTYLASANHLANLHNRPYNITRLTMPWGDLGDHSDKAQEGFLIQKSEAAATSSLDPSSNNNIQLIYCYPFLLLLSSWIMMI